MACDDLSPRIWIRVRDRSRLEVRLVPSDDAYTPNITFRTNAKTPDEEKETWSGSEVTPGPKKILLRSPNRYDLNVLVAFLGAERTTVEVQAVIIRPDRDSTGAEVIHGTPFCERLSGKNGDLRESIIAIHTRRQQ